MIALVCASLLAHASELDEAVLSQTVSRLVATGLYETAYAEYVRAAAMEPAPADRRRYELSATEMLWLGERWDAASYHLSVLPDEPQVRLARGYTLYKAQQWDEASALLSNVPGSDASYLLGWTQLQLKDPEAALAAWSTTTDADLAPNVEALQQAVRSWERIPWRSPALSGVLSAALPGLGQAYVGRWGEAASALLVNGLLIVGTIETARRELWFGAALLGILELGFYGGNVVSAANGARRFNKRQWRVLVHPLLPHSPRLTAGPGGFETVFESP